MQTCKSKKIAWIYLNLRVIKLVKVRKTLEFIWFCVSQKNTWIHLIQCESEKHLNSLDSVWDRETLEFIWFCVRQKTCTENSFQFLQIRFASSLVFLKWLHPNSIFSNILLSYCFTFLFQKRDIINLNFTINGLHYWIIHVYLCRF